jgi:hypothetical protein
MLYVMLVGAYPFERPEDKHDNQKLQKMIQRILHVDYAVPSHIRLSDDCKDLLKKVCGVCACSLARSPPTPPAKAFFQGLEVVKNPIKLTSTSKSQPSQPIKTLIKVLVADPAKRITVEGIYNHPW